MSWSVEGQTVLITGGSSGLGFATAQALAHQGALVTITSRDSNRAERAAARISASTGVAVDTAIVDLADLASVRNFGTQFADDNDHIRVLINNAGGVFGSRRQTVDGHEMTFGTNHLGPFLLTCLLQESLGGSARSRVINVSSVAHAHADEGILFDDLAWENNRYKMMDVYGHSKLANILHARGVNERFGLDVDAFAVHPGVVSTSFGGRGGSFIVRIATKFGGRWMLTPDEGADTIVWLATTPDIDPSYGIYFCERKPEKSTRHARDDAQATRLWEVSEELVAPT